MKYSTLLLSFLAGIILLVLVLFITQLFKKNDSSGGIEIFKTNARELTTDIDFIAGTLEITGQSRKPYNFDYKITDNKWKPIVTYREENKHGYLQIKAFRDQEKIDIGDEDTSLWKLALNKDMENDLTIHMIAGKAVIDLPKSKLKQFDFSMKAGEADIDLSNTSVSNLNMKAIAGEITLDLSGKWENNLNAFIKGGFGEITIIVPRKTAVKLTISGLLGDVSAPGFQKDHHNYTNPMYGKTNECLYIDITGGIGSIQIEEKD